MTPKLREAAKTINILAKQEHDSRRQLCIAIAGAMDLVKSDSNMSWASWANQNLRKPDGSRWSLSTLYQYASFGRDTGKLTHAREAIKSHGQNARKALRVLRPAALATPGSTARQSTIDIDKELSWLMNAWRNASPTARKRFLEMIAEEKQA